MELLGCEDGLKGMCTVDLGWFMLRSEFESAVNEGPSTTPLYHLPRPRDLDSTSCASEAKP